MAKFTAHIHWGYSLKILTFILTSVIGRSFPSVGRAAILSITSKPSITSPKTVYSLSKWCIPPSVYIGIPFFSGI